MHRHQFEIRKQPEWTGEFKGEYYIVSKVDGMPGWLGSDGKLDIRTLNGAIETKYFKSIKDADETITRFLAAQYKEPAMEVIPFSIYAPTKLFADAVKQTLVEKGYKTLLSDYSIQDYCWIQVRKDGTFDAYRNRNEVEYSIAKLVALPKYEPKPQLVIGGRSIEIEGDYLIYDNNYKAPKTEVLEFLRNLFDNRLGAYTMSVEEESQMGVGCLKGQVKEFRAVYDYLAEKSGEEVPF